MLTQPKERSREHLLAVVDPAGSEPEAGAVGDGARLESSRRSLPCVPIHPEAEGRSRERRRVGRASL